MSRRSANDGTFDPSLAKYRTRLVPTSLVVDLLTVSHARDKVEEFRRAMVRGESFPPISGIRLGRRILVADGHKRFSAYRELDRSHLRVEIWPLRRWVSDQAGQTRKTIRRSLKAFREIRHQGHRSREARDLLGGMARHYRRILSSLCHLMSRRMRGARQRLREKTRRFLDWTACGLLSMASRAARHLPRSLLAQCGTTLGFLAYCVLRSHRRTSLQNLEAALGKQFDARRRRRIARASFANLMRTSTLLLGSRRFEDGGILRFLDDNTTFLEHALSIYRRGGGLIICSIHLGDWELGAHLLGAAGIPLRIEPCAGEGEVSPLRRSSRVTRFIWRLRGTTGNRNSETVDGLVSWVARGGAVACLADLNGSFRGPGDWIDFMGMPSYTKNSVGRIASRTGAPILFCWCLPLSGGRGRVESVEVDHPWEAGPTEISRLCLEAAERVINKYPELWLWCYRKWRRRPTPELGGYPAYSKYREIGDVRSGSSGV